MKRHSLIIILSLNSILLMTSCGGNSSKRPIVSNFECKDMHIYVYDSESQTFNQTRSFITTYFFNKSSIPYLSLKDYVDSFLLGFPSRQIAEYTYTSNGGNAYISPNNGGHFKAKLTVNTDAQMINYDNYSGYFTRYTNSKYPLISFMTGGEYLFKDLTYSAQEGSSYSIDLTKYNIKAFNHNNEIYLPYHVCLTALGNNMDDYVYNGNGYYQIPSTDTLQEKMAVVKSIRDTIAHDAFNEEYQQYGYDHLAFIFDNYFGLDKRQKRTGNKEDYVYFKDGAYKALEKYQNDLKSTLPDVSNNAFKSFYNEHVNDGGHSNYYDYNIFATQKRTVDNTGDVAFTDSSYFALVKERKDRQLEPLDFGDQFIGYTQTIDNVLFITMDSFIPIKNEYTSEDFSDTEYGKCAITILGRANEEMQKNQNIKNVVFDMSCNTGGAGFMPLQILSWINKGNMNFAVKNNMDGTILKGSGHADINLDGVFDSKDYLADDVNVYFICSPTSFSSGNYVCCLASEINNVKFIGERSGGGSCNIDYKSNAFGSTMSVSGNIQLCFNKEEAGTLISDEKGVVPSFYPITLSENDLSNAPLFFDRQTIANKILGK